MVAELTRSRPRASTRFGAALLAIVALGGVPVVLTAVSRWRLGSSTPLGGASPPWRWSKATLSRWWDTLTGGLTTSQQLVDVFARVALVGAWLCLAGLIAVVVTESLYIVRHGMSSAAPRRWLGIGTLGRWIAAGLVSVLPLHSGAVSAQGSGPAQRPAPVATVVQPRFGPVLQRAGLSLPATPADDDPVHSVRRGESVWSIAEQYAVSGDVASMADAILRLNLGTEMNDGQRFVTAALIEPGWELRLPSGTQTASRPVDPPEPPGQQGAHRVVAGDSYWAVAEDHLDAEAGREVTEREIFDYVPTLIGWNAPRLGYDDPAMIHPGDVLYFAPTPLFDPPPPEVPQPDAPQPGLSSPATVPTTLPPTTTTAPDPTTPATAPDPTTPPSPVATVPATTPVSTTQPERSDPSDTVAPFAPPPPSNQPAIPLPVTLTGGTLLATGAALLIAQRRRAALRRARVGQRVRPPAPAVVAVEVRLAELSDLDRIARVDLALRAAASDLADQQAQVRAVTISDDGQVALLLNVAATPVARYWRLDPGRNAWILPADVDITTVSDDARRSAQPCPAIAHLGRSADGELFVDLEAFGLLAIEDNDDLVRAVAGGLCVSPLGEPIELVTVGGIELSAVAGGEVRDVADLAGAARCARTHLERLAPLASGSSTFALRARRSAMGSNEPMVVVVGAGPTADDASELMDLARAGGRGLAVLLSGPIHEGAAVIRRAAGGWRLDPMGIEFEPIACPPHELVSIGQAIDAADRLLDDVEPIWIDSVMAETEPVPEPEPGPETAQWALLVRLLGPVAVETRLGEPVSFERSKSLELVAWLTQHRAVGSRVGARTALWGSEVRDATFTNVVSEARRALARAVEPPDGAEWIGRSTGEQLPLHPLVITDADVLASAVAAARRQEGGEAIDTLRHGLELVRGMPFAGAAYLWPDAEGVTSSLILAVTGAAADMAAIALDEDRIDDVFWATQQGLLALPGHDELVAMRMRAHAQRGDRAGVRHEFDSYERAVRADVWSSGEPAPKLVTLRRELLGIGAPV